MSDCMMAGKFEIWMLGFGMLAIMVAKARRGWTFGMCNAWQCAEEKKFYMCSLIGTERTRLEG